MKRIIIAVVMIAIAVSASIFGYFDLKKSAEQITASLNDVIYAANSGDEIEAAALAEKSVMLYQSKRTRLQMYLNHSEIDDIELNFKDIKRYSEGTKDIEINNLCYDCINNFEHIVESEKPDIGTIF